MQPGQITAALSERLHRKGVCARPEDVEAFAAGLPPRQRDLDLDALMERFIRASRSYAERRPARWPLRLAITGGSVFFAASAAFLGLERWYAGTNGGPEALLAGNFLEIFAPACLAFMVVGLVVGGCGALATAATLWRPKRPTP